MHLRWFGTSQRNKLRWLYMQPNPKNLAYHKLIRLNSLVQFLPPNYPNSFLVKSNSKTNSQNTKTQILSLKLENKNLKSVGLYDALCVTPRMLSELPSFEVFPMEEQRLLPFKRNRNVVVLYHPHQVHKYALQRPPYIRHYQ